MRVSIRTMCEEAVKRLEILGVPKKVIKDFKDDSIDRRYHLSPRKPLPLCMGRNRLGKV